MARPLRIEYPGAFCHMTSRGNEQKAIYKSHRDRMGQNCAGPHAVTTAGSLSYTYDANGNMTSGDGRTLSYDSEDRLTRAVKNGNVVDFAYDQDGDRIRKSTRTTISTLTSAITLNVETIYLGNLYEIEKINGYVAKVTKHYYLNADKIASREIVNGATQTLYFYHGDQIGSSNIRDSRGRFSRRSIKLNNCGLFVC